MIDPFEQAAEELASRTPVRALYARAYADALGDEKLANAFYIKIRAAELAAQSAGEVRRATGADLSYDCFLRDYKRRNRLWFLVLPCFLKMYYQAWLDKRTSLSSNLGAEG